MFHTLAGRASGELCLKYIFSLGAFARSPLITRCIKPSAFFLVSSPDLNLLTTNKGFTLQIRSQQESFHHLIVVEVDWQCTRLEGAYIFHIRSGRLDGLGRSSRGSQEHACAHWAFPSSSGWLILSSICTSKVHTFHSSLKINGSSGQSTRA
jgi:hypothetical protein